MKRYKSLLSLKWVAALLLVVGFVSCADEEIISGKTDVIEGIETEINLAFTSATPSVQTRGALDVKQEYKVYNLYVFVFEPTPRIRIVPASCPGLPLSCVMVTPDI